MDVSYIFPSKTIAITLSITSQSCVYFIKYCWHLFVRDQTENTWRLNIMYKYIAHSLNISNTSIVFLSHFQTLTFKRHSLSWFSILTVSSYSRRSSVLVRCRVSCRSLKLISERYVSFKQRKWLHSRSGSVQIKAHGTILIM